MHEFITILNKLCTAAFGKILQNVQLVSFLLLLYAISGGMGPCTLCSLPDQLALPAPTTDSKKESGLACIHLFALRHALPCAPVLSHTLTFKRLRGKGNPPTSYCAIVQFGEKFHDLWLTGSE